MDTYFFTSLFGETSHGRQRFRGLPEEPTMHFVQLALPTLPGMSGRPRGPSGHPVGEGNVEKNMGKTSSSIGKWWENDGKMMEHIMECSMIWFDDVSPWMLQVSVAFPLTGQALQCWIRRARSPPGPPGWMECCWRSQRDLTIKNGVRWTIKDRDNWDIS